MRGEGNHKIPGSFAPENMEKTGAERVKYSLACQHEDAIPIKFVSYAQKCPTVLCTFAVALRKESVDRNLSNYCTCPITIDGLTYRSAEAAFQAAKCSDPIDRAAFCTVPPNVAKAIGRKIKLRDGWEKERDGIMADIIHAKFSQNPGFAQALIDTDDAELIEGNTWNDNYWGMCGCTRCRSEGTKGLNKLGKILMAERARLQAATPAVTEEG